MSRPQAAPIAAPKGTRDLYPDEHLRQAYICKLWRDTAVRHGFEEINGPTFEMLELYKKKSGEGIVSELFSFRRQGGDDDYALRPEFTPTLARMYAAKAASLPSPTKWFSIGPYFRAEKPQRGRLREFLQWNVDILGGDTPEEQTRHDVESIGVVDSLLRGGGVPVDDVATQLNHRGVFQQILSKLGIPPGSMESAFALADRAAKINSETFIGNWMDLGAEREPGERLRRVLLDPHGVADARDRAQGLWLQFRSIADRLGIGELSADAAATERTLRALFEQLARADVGHVQLVPSIVRGLAYYTGTVFEVIAEGERAIAGGGRYDNLIELFGGPPTPAVGFGMGDVVLGLLLDDKGLMPQGKDLLDALSQPAASLRPDAFVIAGSEDEDALVEPLLANLRRGIEHDGFSIQGGGKPWAADRYAVRPVHARRTYKTTRNLKKLLSDAEKQHARYAIVLHGEDKVQVKNLDTREELAHDERGDFSVRPESDAYVGAALAHALP
ncbi:MAG: ATP phosphoribosyltransferase regulatory subunit [Planctomycetota bacterium]